jgi:hypothetical protein
MSRNYISGLQELIASMRKDSHSVRPWPSYEEWFQNKLKAAPDMETIFNIVKREWFQKWYRPTEYFYANLIVVLDKFDDTYGLQKELYKRSDKEKAADAVCYNVMLERCALHKDIEYSRVVMADVQQKDTVEFNIRTYNAALNVAVACDSESYADEQIDEAAKQGILLDKFSMSALFKLARNLPSTELARKYIQLAMANEFELDIVCINILIDLTARAQQPQFLDEVFVIHEARKLTFNDKSILMLLKVAAHISSPEYAHEVFSLAGKHNIPLDISQINIFLDAIANANKADAVSRAKEIYEGIPRRNLKPDSFTYSALLKIAANAGDFDFADDIFQIIKLQKIEISAGVIGHLLRVAIFKKSIPFAEDVLKFAAKCNVPLSIICINSLIQLAGIIEPADMEFADRALRRFNWSVKPNAQSFSELYHIAVRADSNAYAEKVRVLEKKTGLKPTVICSNKVRALTMLGDAKGIRDEWAKSSEPSVVLDSHDYAAFCDAAKSLEPFDLELANQILGHMTRHIPRMDKPLEIALVILARTTQNREFNIDAFKLLNIKHLISSAEDDSSLVHAVLDCIEFAEDVSLAKQVMQRLSELGDFEYDGELFNKVLHIAAKAKDFKYVQETLLLCRTLNITVSSPTYSVIIKLADEHGADLFVREVFTECASTFQEICPITEKGNLCTIDLHGANYKIALLLLERYNLPRFETVKIIFGRGLHSKDDESPVQNAIVEFLATQYNIKLSEQDLDKGFVTLRKDTTHGFVISNGKAASSVATSVALFKLDTGATPFVPSDDPATAAASFTFDTSAAEFVPAGGATRESDTDPSSAPWVAQKR